MKNERTETAKLGVGIIGYGYAGEVIHAPLVGLVDNLDLVAVSTGRCERAEVATARGYTVYPTAKELLADSRVDLVIIATPHDTHLPLAIEACEAGKHVVCDKLMALDVDQAEQMTRAAQKAGVTLSVFHNRRWDGDFLAIAAATGRDSSVGVPLSEIPVGYGGSVGNPIRIRSWVQSANRRSPDVWRARRSKGGGIFSDWGAHLLDQALLLHNGKTESVYCTMHHSDPAIEVETGALCIIEFDDGSSHLLETNHMYHEASKGYECWGTDGRIVVKGFDPREDMLKREMRGYDGPTSAYTATLYADGATTPLPSPPTAAWEAYYQNVARHILYGDDLVITPESVLRVMRVREAALLSVEKGDVIRTSL